jgi:hypothetical protein
MVSFLAEEWMPCLSPRGRKSTQILVATQSYFSSPTWARVSGLDFTPVEQPSGGNFLGKLPELMPCADLKNQALCDNKFIANAVVPLAPCPRTRT